MGAGDRENSSESGSSLSATDKTRLAVITFLGNVGKIRESRREGLLTLRS